jgi:hypothetical protein
MLLGAESFVDEGRVWRTRMAGNLPTVMPYLISSTNAVRQHLGDVAPSLTKLQTVVQRLTQINDQGYAMWFVPAVPQTPMVHVYLRDKKDVLIEARDRVAAAQGIWLFDDLTPVPQKLWGKLCPKHLQAFRGDSASQNIRSHIDLDEFFFEWQVGPRNRHIDTEKFVEGWQAFLEFRHRIFNERRFGDF